MAKGESSMSKQEFMHAHPDFAWWTAVTLLVLLMVGCVALYRYKHPPVEHEERHHHYGSMMLWLLALFVVGVVGWVISVIWHKDFWSMLHIFLS